MIDQGVATMKARRGRKAQPGLREANGRLKRPTRQEMQRIEQLKREGEKAYVLNQPHRRGDARTELASAFGRFILRLPAEFRVQLEHAGNAYAQIVRGWRAAKGVPVDSRGGEPGSGLGPSDRTVEGWARKMLDADRAMVDVSLDGRLYVRQLVLDDYDVGMDQEGHARAALWALAVHFGMLKVTRHPYGL